ncbi:unnamed protein product [Leptosia nina]|uniref:Uncharacterized protein n=1 Tax=Leptosia nina TaxID=320188 RepID=A0AAV1JRN5_9NEOP
MRAKRLEVENNPRRIITVGISWKQYGVEASAEAIAPSRSLSWCPSEREWAGRAGPKFKQQGLHIQPEACGGEHTWLPRPPASESDRMPIEARLLAK